MLKAALLLALFTYIVFVSALSAFGVSFSWFISSMFSPALLFFLVFAIVYNVVKKRFFYANFISCLIYFVITSLLVVGAYEPSQKVFKKNEAFEIIFSHLNFLLFYANILALQALFSRNKKAIRVDESLH